jgi:hypothetical protein
MDNITICKRIAEIERLRNHIYFRKVQVDRTPNKSINTSWINWEDYNPLTDDALCFKLMDKYNVSINTHFQNPDTKQAYVTYLKGFRVVTTDVFSINDLGINKAICLAIIEAHK